MANPTVDRTGLNSYYETRVQLLRARIIDLVDDLFGAESIQHNRAFEEQVERRLKNGAKFIPRKRQPR
jgi:hypothetical protein